MIELKNDFLKVTVSEHGAELQSIVKDGREYLWHGDAAYWGRRAPILFPIVGKVFDNQYRVGEKTYQLPQHGFARDCDFSVAELTEDKVVLMLKYSESTLEKYPYMFALSVEYRLTESSVKETIKVENLGSGKMYFQVGIHPAFMFRNFNPSDEKRGFALFTRNGKKVSWLVISSLTEKGCLSEITRQVDLTDGKFALGTSTFAKDALILENSQADEVTMLDNENQPVVSLRFDAPVMGIWSPAGKNAPFMCIEPWFGRCDRDGFRGDISQREWINVLDPATSFAMAIDMEFR